MIRFKTIIKKFASKGEKTGWTYIEIPASFAEQLKPGYKKSFPVKGLLDSHYFSAITLLPIGNGDFIMPLNATVRKAIRKNKGDELMIEIEEDINKYEINKDLMECLKEEYDAMNFFNTLAKSHRNYFSKWIDAAKTIETKSKRIARVVNALANNWDYSTMIKMQTKENKKLKEL
ncbi:MAG: YdeI/OmpD-associated family protein [Arachidicoccus sp.]|nr:YdeI/OmpD-associated family protein [Arachidicoccus sp.]